MRDYFQHRGQFPQILSIHASQSLWTLRPTLRWEEPETPGTGAGLQGTEVLSKEPFILRKPDSTGGPALGSHPPGDPALCEESVQCSPHMCQHGPAWEPHRGVRHIPCKGIPRPAVRASRRGWGRPGPPPERALTCRLTASGCVRSAGAGGGHTPGLPSRALSQEERQGSDLVSAVAAPLFALQVKDVGLRWERPEPHLGTNGVQADSWASGIMLPPTEGPSAFYLSELTLHQNRPESHRDLAKVPTIFTFAVPRDSSHESSMTNLSFMSILCLLLFFKSSPQNI